MTALTQSNGFGMRRRLLLAQTLVLLAGGVTTWVVALMVGPALFREHLHRAGVANDSNEQFHAEQAYQHATAISIAVAITVAALTALIVTPGSTAPLESVTVPAMVASCAYPRPGVARSTAAISNCLTTFIGPSFNSATSSEFDGHTRNE